MCKINDDDVLLMRRTHFLHRNNKVKELPVGSFVLIKDLEPRDTVHMLNDGIAVKQNSSYVTITLNAFEIGIIEDALWQYYNSRAIRWSISDSLWLRRELLFAKSDKKKHNEAVLKKKEMSMAKYIIKRLTAGPTGEDEEE